MQENLEVGGKKGSKLDIHGLSLYSKGAKKGKKHCVNCEKDGDNESLKIIELYTSYLHFQKFFFDLVKQVRSNMTI